MIGVRWQDTPDSGWQPRSFPVKRNLVPSPQTSWRPALFWEWCQEGFYPLVPTVLLSTHPSYLQASLHPGRVLMLFPLEDTGQESSRHASLKAKQTGRTSVFLFLGLFPCLDEEHPPGASWERVSNSDFAVELFWFLRLWTHSYFKDFLCYPWYIYIFFKSQYIIMGHFLWHLRGFFKLTVFFKIGPQTSITSITCEKC